MGLDDVEKHEFGIRIALAVLLLTRKRSILIHAVIIHVITEALC